MNAETTTNRAAPSTSTAQPAASPAAPADLEADLGISGADIAAALEELNPTTPSAGADDSPELAAPAAETGDEPSPEDDAAAADPSPSSETEEPAAETEGEPAPETEAAPAAEAPSEPAPKPNAEFQRRIDELTYARKSAEETAAQLRERLASYEARDAGRLEPDVLETIQDPATPANRAAWERLAEWKKPFLTAFSDQDPITRGADVFLQAAIPGAEGQPHTTLTGGGHFLQEDCGPALARVVADFIAAT